MRTEGGEVVREVCAWALAHPEAARWLCGALSGGERGPLGAITDMAGTHPAATKSLLRDCPRTNRLLVRTMFFPSNRPKRKGKTPS